MSNVCPKCGQDFFVHNDDGSCVEYNYEDLPMTNAVHWAVDLTLQAVHWGKTIGMEPDITDSEITRRVTAIVTCPNCGDDLLVPEHDVATCHNCHHTEQLVKKSVRCPCGNSRMSMLLWQGDDHRDGIKCAICGTLYTP